MGGETLEFEVSAKTGDGLSELLDGLQLQAEILDLRANPERSAEGTVIEAKLDRGRGPVATVLVQRGTLHPGDILVAGAEWAACAPSSTISAPPRRKPAPRFRWRFWASTAPRGRDRVAVVDSEAAPARSPSTAPARSASVRRPAWARPDGRWPT
jgi:translation initiation factor IF-2